MSGEFGYTLKSILFVSLADQRRYMFVYFLGVILIGMPPPFGDRKRGPGDFGASGGEGSWRKRPRFEEPVVPPATLRVLIRNQDAGGIIGKVGPPASLASV